MRQHAQRPGGTGAISELRALVQGTLEIAHRPSESLCLLQDVTGRRHLTAEDQGPTLRSEHLGALARLAIETLHRQSTFDELQGVG